MSKDQFDFALRSLLAEHKRIRCTRSTRGSLGQWLLPGKHEAELLNQLRDGVAKGWWIEYSPSEVSQAMGDCLAWLYFSVEQTKDSGEKTLRGCLAPDEINKISNHPEKTIYFWCEWHC